MAWYTQSTKDHWLAKVEELGNRFNPDCGNYMDRWGHYGPPFEMLINKFGPFEWDLGEKEFGIPRWVLELVSKYMHEVHPARSREIVKTMFESVPVYVDLEPVRHKFAIYLLTRAVVECGWYSCTLKNPTKPTIHVAEALAPSIVQHQLCIVNPKYKYDSDANTTLKSMMEDVMVSFNAREEAISNLSECCANGWTDHAASSLLTLNKLCGNDVGEDEDGYADFYDEIFNKMIEMLKEANQDVRS